MRCKYKGIYMCWKITIGVRTALRWVASLLLNLLKDVVDDEDWDAIFKVFSQILDVEGTRNIPSSTKTENKEEKISSSQPETSSTV
jgi:hypothetical protein